MITLTIAGVDRTAWLALGYSLDIEKVLSAETMHLAILDLDSTADALRIPVGAEIVLIREDGTETGELLFGGEVANVIDEPIIDDTGTVTRIRARDRMHLADQVFLPPQTFAEAPVREVFTPIVETYLGPKGVTVISSPTGGVVIPELAIEDFVTSVRQTLDRITLASGWPWRINGAKDASIDEPGELMGPATLADDGLTVLTDPPLRWEKQNLTNATRVFVQTAVPEAGPGPYEHTEEWTADGVQGVYPVRVLPTEIGCSTSAAAEAFEASLALTGLPRDMSIRLGARLRVEWHTQVYTVTAGVTTNADGEVTVALDAALERDVPEGHSVTFLRGSFEQLELDDVVTPLDGAPYVWDPIENAIVYPGGAFDVGVVVRRRTWIEHPTVVRVWADAAQQDIGWFDYATIIDQRVTEEEGHRTIDGAVSFAQAELARRLTPPKRVTCTTQIPGHYPLLTVPMDFPDRLVVGDYLVTETRIRHSNIDENGEILGVTKTQPFFYELVLWEGDAIGESWIQYFRGRNPAQGIRWGAPVEIDGCGSLRLTEDWAPGDSASHQSAHWETVDGPNTGSDPADALYPDAVASEFSRVVTALGPNGENVLDAFDGSDPGNTAYVWTVGPFLADCGTVQADYNITSAYWADIDTLPSHPFCAVYTSKAAFTTGDLTVIAKKSGSNLVFHLVYANWSGSTTTVASGTLPSSSVVDEWRRFKLQWQCGTVTRNGNPANIRIADVAFDGWIKVWYGEDLIYDLTGLDLYLYIGGGSTDRVNEVGTVSVGYYGLPGLMTNLSVKGGQGVGAAEGAHISTIINTYTKIGEDGDSTNAVALDAPFTVSEGDTIIVGVSVWNYDEDTPGTVADGTNTYTLIEQYGDNVAHESGIRVYKATAAASGSVTPEYTPAVTEYVSIGVVHTGGTTTVHQTATATASNASPSTFGVTLPATTVPNCLILAFLSNELGDGGLTAHTGYTLKYMLDPSNTQATLSCVSKNGFAPAVYTPQWDAANGGYEYYIVGIALAPVEP